MWGYFTAGETGEKSEEEEETPVAKLCSSRKRAAKSYLNKKSVASPLEKASKTQAP